MDHMIIKHVHQSLDVEISIYDKSGKRLEYYGDFLEDNIVHTDEKLRNTLFSKSEESYPVLYEEIYPIYYMVILHGETYYILGPLNGNYRLAKLENKPLADFLCEKHGKKISGYRIPANRLRTFCEECLLLFNILKQGHMDYDELMEKNQDIERINGEVEKELYQIYFKNQECEHLHNSYNQEVRELNFLREGNVEKMVQTMDEVNVEDCAILSKEPLQAMKNLAIVALAIAARAAIEGGMLPEESFSINDSYIIRVDSAHTVAEVTEITRNAKIKYAQMVRELKNRQQGNRIIEDAKNIMFKNMHGKIKIQEIAEQLYVTPEYLATLFKRTEGVSPNEYMIQKKIKLTENMLIYSNFSIEQISYYLGFCSQSHMSKHFKKHNGMTPQRFRDKYAAKEFME